VKIALLFLMWHAFLGHMTHYHRYYSLQKTGLEADDITLITPVQTWVDRDEAPVRLWFLV